LFIAWLSCVELGVGPSKYPQAVPDEQLRQAEQAHPADVFHADVPGQRMEPADVQHRSVHAARVPHQVRGNGTRPGARQLPAAQGVLQPGTVRGRAAAQRVQDVSRQTDPAQTAGGSAPEKSRQEKGAGGESQRIGG